MRIKHLLCFLKLMMYMLEKTPFKFCQIIYEEFSINKRKWI